MKLLLAIALAIVAAIAAPALAAEKPVLWAAGQAGLSTNVSVQGSVLYLAKINPRPGSRLIITIEDAAIADAPAKRIKRGRYRIETVPFKFLIRVPRRSFGHDGSLSLRAEIKGPDGRLMWVSDTHIGLMVDPFSKYINVGEIILTGAN